MDWNYRPAKWEVIATVFIKPQLQESDRQLWLSTISQELKSKFTSDIDYHKSGGVYGILNLLIATEKSYSQWQYSIVWIVEAMFTNKGLFPHKEIPFTLDPVNSTKRHSCSFNVPGRSGYSLFALFPINIFTDQDTNAYLLLW